jgi:hypothetical protein
LLQFLKHIVKPQMRWVKTGIIRIILNSHTVADVFNQLKRSWLFKLQQDSFSFEGQKKGAGVYCSGEHASKNLGSRLSLMVQLMYLYAPYLCAKKELGVIYSILHTPCCLFICDIRELIATPMYREIANEEKNH